MNSDAFQQLVLQLTDPLFRFARWRLGQREEAVGPREPEDLYLPVPGGVPTDARLLALGVLAIVLMLGLIPLWYMVARAWGVIG